MDAEWTALRAGRQADARKHYLAARQLCEARGFDYVPLSELTAPEADLDALVARLLSLAKDGNLEAGPVAVAAVMGTVPEALPHLGEIFESVAEATKSERLKKTEAQEEKWRAPRLLAIRHFTELRGDKPFDQYTREDGLAFRKWWLDRVASGYSINMGNKELGWLAKMVRLWLELQAIERDNPFAGLRLQGSNAGHRPAFSRDWVRDKLLAPGALDGLNEEARDVLLVMVNTALGPGEILGAAQEDWNLSANIPHVSVHDGARTLKTTHRGRDVPGAGRQPECLPPDRGARGN